MRSIGIIVTDLGPSQLAFMILKQTELLKGLGWSSFIFYESLMRPCINPTVATMNISESVSFDGHCLSTNLNQTKLLLNNNTRGKKIFYVWDLEWLRGHDNFDFNSDIYRDENLILITRSQEHSDALKNYCNRKADHIVDNVNLSEIVKKCNLQ